MSLVERLRKLINHPIKLWHGAFAVYGGAALQADPAEVRAESTTRQQLLNQCKRPGP